MKLPLLRSSLILTCLVSCRALAAFDVYVSPYDVESAEDSGITGVSTENFSSRPVGAFTNFASSTIDGSYTLTSGTVAIQANNQYGGYQEGNQLAVDNPGSVTLTLNTPVKYFGFYFTAGDANNKIELYDGPTLVLTFSTGSLISLLPNNPTSKVTAINGTQYFTKDYYGQPVSGLNANEAYAYLHFIATGGSTFNRIVLSEPTGAIFENDNHSVRATAPAVPGTLVVVPEPASLAWCGLGLLALRRRR
jgi:hypothetical protein